MCGIFGAVCKQKKAKKAVWKGLVSLEYRGYDSWGMAVKVKRKGNRKGNVLSVIKQIGDIHSSSADSINEGYIAIGHTRWATHGKVSKKNAHPHLNCTNTLAIVHNGIIENYEYIKNKLEKKGHKFSSDTDSEVFAHLITEEKKKTKSLIQAIRIAFQKIKGYNAFLVISLYDDMIYGIRNGSSLIVGKGEIGNYISSDEQSLYPFIESILYLEEGKIAQIGKDTVYLLDIESGKKTTAFFTSSKMKKKIHDKDGYPHYMLKEIEEQPKVISLLARQKRSDFSDFMKHIIHAENVYFIGCGSAGYASMASSYLFSSLCNFPVTYSIASEFDKYTPFITKKSFVVALSQSGETIDTILAVKKAQNLGACIGALVNVQSSSLERCADTTIYLNAGVEKAVASTKSFTAKIAQVILLASLLNKNYRKGKKLLEDTSNSILEILSMPLLKKIKNIARKLSSAQNIYTVGRGPFYTISLESSLKIKEVSYIHAEGFAGGELKHGVLALIENKTPCIVYASKDAYFDETISGALEVRARGGYIIGISDTYHDVFNEYIPVQNTKEATIITSAVVAQLLAYYISCYRGYNPDMPRNLAKSVTVK